MIVITSIGDPLSSHRDVMSFREAPLDPSTLRDNAYFDSPFGHEETSLGRIST